jgi:hypothetical protein
MKDVTDQFKFYRECVRHLWNIQFRPVVDSARPSFERTWDIRDEFDEIARSIFSSLVLNPMGLFNHKLSAASSSEPSVLPDFRIVPSSKHGVRILINRDLPRSGYWDHPVSEIKPEDVELHLLRFFDFDQLGFRDFRYYEVIIHASPTFPEIVGRAALIDFNDAKVLLEKR